MTQFELKKGTTLLDVGTGIGELLPLLLKCIDSEGSITAIDFSERMIQRASDKFKDRENIKFSITSVEDLPFKTKCFDSVICFGAFPHFEDK